MKLVLALDPGIKTGYALLLVGPDREIIPVDYGSLTSDQLTYLQRPGFRCAEAVVIERTPIPTLSQMNNHLRAITNELSQMFGQAEYIGPGVWKSSRYATVIPENVLASREDFRGSQHEYDAFRLGLYYLHQRGEL